MHTLLEKLLGKRNIKQEELSNEEKPIFDKWNKVLSNEQITVSKIKEFCQTQKDLIESQWSNLDNSSQKNDRLVLMHTIYSKLARATEADKTERESLERYLNQLIDSEPSEKV